LVNLQPRVEETMGKRSRFRSLLYSKGGRWYANLKSYQQWGGRCEALIPSGQRFATEDRDVAEALLATRLAELERNRRLNPHPTPAAQVTYPARQQQANPTFAAYAEHVFTVYEDGNRVTQRHARELRGRTRAFAAFLGSQKRLDDISEADVIDFLASLGRRGCSGSTQRHYLNAISTVYRRARQETTAESPVLTDRRHNPARDLDRADKPRVGAGGEAFLEVHEAALLVDTAFLVAEAHPHRENARDATLAAVAIATGLLTGGRRNEVMGLLVTDLDFTEDEEVVRFEPHKDRRLKNQGSKREVPLWPQLAGIMRAHLNRREAAVIAGQRPSRYLFPTLDGHHFVQDIGKCFESAVATAGLGHRFQSEWWRVLRRTYATTRLQTTDGFKRDSQGQLVEIPVSEYVVEKELGHSSGAMLRKVYGKVSRKVRQRAPVVEYRLEPFLAEDGPLSKVKREELGEMVAARDRRLQAFRAPVLPPEPEVIATR
jgi:integrase